MHLVRIDARFAGQRQQAVEVLRRRLGAGAALRAARLAGASAGLRRGPSRSGGHLAGQRRLDSSGRPDSEAPAASGAAARQRRQGRQFRQLGDAGDRLQRLLDLCAIGRQPALAPASSRREICTIRSTPDSSTRPAGVLCASRRPCWAATKLSSMPAVPPPAGRAGSAAPLIECAARTVHHLNRAGAHVAGLALEGQQAIRSGYGMAVRLHAEQFEHRKAAQVAVLVLAHRNSLAS